MLDFLYITEEEVKRRDPSESHIKVIPGFRAIRSDDLMIRGNALYAVWDEEGAIWTQSIYDLVRIVDRVIKDYISGMPEDRREMAQPQFLINESNGRLSSFHRYCKNVDDNFVQLDQSIIFSDDPVEKTQYATKRLNYSPIEGDISSYSELFGALYEYEEMRKLEWAVGGVLSGDAKKIQKIVTLYGAPGTGKSTFIDLVEDLFQDYAVPFKAEDLGDSSKSFALEVFKNGPLVAFDHDGSLNKLNDNTVLNSIVAHDKLQINEKHKSQYPMELSTFLFLGTNKLVKITDSFSGLTRRLLDVHPTGRIHPPSDYHRLVGKLKFELGAIAHHCMSVYSEMGRSWYDDYKPTRMIYGTNALHNFVDHYALEFEQAEYTTLQQAFAWYQQYMDESNEKFTLTRKEFSEELKHYFEEYHVRNQSLEGRPRHVYVGFKADTFKDDDPRKVVKPQKEERFKEIPSVVDDILKDCPAQLANEHGTPERKWDEVTTTLGDVDTGRLHFVKPPQNHIVIDFDLVDGDGKKSAKANREAIRDWPTTYAEYSKSGSGIHLHYIYAGDTDRLSRIFAPGIEIKVFNGNASLRRKYSRSNGLAVATLTGGLPQKEVKVIDDREVKSEAGLRRLVQMNLGKKVHAGTKPSIDFIHKILTDAYESEYSWDLTDMKKAVTIFAMQSTNQSEYCLRLVRDIPFRSKKDQSVKEFSDADRITYLDLEVYPNLTAVGWKYKGDAKVVKILNPTPQQWGEIMSLKYKAYNGRKYDNHIIYAGHMGYSQQQIYQLSRALVNNERTPFISAYSISYADPYCYAAKKQSLKKWQIELGLRHVELDLPWDKPVPEDRIQDVLDYLENDVVSLEKVDEYLEPDFKARQILADLSGLTVNHTTNNHTTKIIFGDNKTPQGEFNYPDLSETFPGYKFEWGKSEYKGHDPSEGGFVYAEPGMYKDISVFDVTSMHPSSIIAMNLFGDRYTAKFKELVDARVAIKKGDYDAAGKMLGGKLLPYLSDSGQSKGMSDALKIAINSVYGLTAAKFDNPFKDPRNKENIVAKRGALFMIDLLEACREKGYSVVHIKTDSAKLVLTGLDSSVIEEFVREFGQNYGYTFEVEDEYESFCLVNDAVYIAKKTSGKYEAVGAQFQHPVVFKSLFSKEPLSFDDYVEVKNVTTSLWLNSPDGEHHFVGRAGAFVPVASGGYELVRQNKDGSFASATGAKGHQWVEAEVEKSMSGGRYDNLDMSYYDGLIDKAIANISRFGDPNEILAA